MRVIKNRGVEGKKLKGRESERGAKRQSCGVSNV